MAEDTNGPDTPSDYEAPEEKANVPDPERAPTLDIREDVEKAEHIPPVIIRDSSFVIEHAHRLTPVALPSPLPAPFDLAFMYNDPPLAFHMRGIKFVCNTFGYPETLYYNPNPRGCVVEIVTSNPVRQFRLFTTTISNLERLVLATDVDLPEEVEDPHHPHRKFSRTLGGSVQLERLTVIDSATSNILYRTHTPESPRLPLKGFHLGVLREH